jgi:hypothetical protein
MAKVKVLVVGGGGSGGSPFHVGHAGGGGGGGGYVYNSYFNITKQNYSVVVGLGGVAPNQPSSGVSGGPSSFSSITANGGGGGGAGGAGGNGGCGGGGSCPFDGTSAGGVGSQGKNGGSGMGGPNSVVFMSASGGGGGASTNGTNGVLVMGASATAGNGGAGTYNDISGTGKYYAGGGGGAAYYSGVAVYQGAGGTGGGGAANNPGTANTGGGGGGSTSQGATGGSGVVVIRYLTADFGTCTGGTKTTDGDYTVHTFLSSGTFVSNPKPEVSTSAPSNVYIKKINATGNIIDAGGTVTERGFCYITGTTGDPDISDDKVFETGSYSAGTYSKEITGLTDGIYYRVRAYATNDIGTSYGSTITVKTTGVTTKAETDLKITKLIANGTISASQAVVCTRRGFCYKVGTTGDPTTSDSVVYDDGSFSIGNYSKAITDLTADTSYRLSAYVVDSSGTAYGDTIQVVTKAKPTSSGSFIALLNR